MRISATLMDESGRTTSISGIILINRGVSMHATTKLSTVRYDGEEVGEMTNKWRMQEDAMIV